jgi:GNAT superfamily N-acetyltransferase
MVDGNLETRGRDWQRSVYEAVCDSLESWEHGTIARLDAHPTFHAYNTVIVEGTPGLGAFELMAVAEEFLGALDHRKVDFEVAEEGLRVWDEFEAAGWQAEHLIWMLHDGSKPPGSGLEVSEVAYDDVEALRFLWHDDDPDGKDPRPFLKVAREVSLQRCARVFAHSDGGEPLGYAQLEGCDPAAAEVLAVFVTPERRGEGIGTALTRAAIAGAEGIDDLWICADYDGAPRRIYERLGFQPAWATVAFTKT